LARIRGVGHRTHGERRRTAKGVGWEYVHVAIDDHSRVAYVEVLADQRGETCGAFLTRSVAWFAARAIAVRQVMSDNGSGYVSRRCRVAGRALDLRHIRTRPYTPRTNGKAQRFIQTLLCDWAYVVANPSSLRRTRQLEAFVRYYNRRRPHASLDYHAPWSRVRVLRDEQRTCTQELEGAASSLLWITSRGAWAQRPGCESARA
jgi:transposase InsO family protein